MTDRIVMDGPDDTCFGCGQANHQGLRMRFRRTGDASVEAGYTVPDAYNGAQGVVHGGIQAALLDEVMGVAVHVSLGDDAPLPASSGDDTFGSSVRTIGRRGAHEGRGPLASPLATERDRPLSRSSMASGPPCCPATRRA